MAAAGAVVFMGVVALAAPLQSTVVTHQNCPTLYLS